MKYIAIYFRFLAILLLFISVQVNGQTFFTATHTSGTTTIGGNNVTATAIGAGTVVTGFGCTTIGPYWIGISNASLGKVAYLYEFSNKAQQVRVRVSGMNNGEVFRFFVNGVQYPITSANVSSHFGSCSGTTPMAAASGGDLIMPTGVGNGQVVINPGVPIDSFRVYHIGVYQGGGVVYSFEFVNDSSIYIKQPYTDTVFCQNDTFKLKYLTTRTFNSGNTFTVQLSDASGSFASPVNIGSVSGTGTANDSIPCVIPATALAGTGYRVRIVSSNPAFTSNDNGINIRIKTLPNVLATSNTPVCAGDTIKLFGSSTTTGVSYGWTGPSGYTATSQNNIILNATTAKQGDYILAVNSQGCTAKDTATVVVKTMPATPVAGSNTPVCPGGTINLSANSSTGGVSYAWSGPSSFTSSTQNPAITGATVSNSGMYYVTATLNGCTSAAGSTNVQVYITTPTPTASSNSPVCEGATLNLNANNISGATYAWVGPLGYSSTAQNPVVGGVTAAMAGTYSVTATLNGCTSQAGTVTVTVRPAPNVNIYPSPKDSICVGGSITVVAVANNAGANPQYQWYKNNIAIPGATGVNYTTASVADNDIFNCIMVSPSVCSSPYADTSNVIPVRVLPYLAPSVSITANPNTTVASGTLINFTATPVNAGKFPQYQWTRNGVNVVGALSNLWGANSLSNGDVICTEITSNYLCPNPTTAKSNCIKVSIETTGISGTGISNSQPAIYPNPTKDKLIIEGITKGTRIQLNDVVGRTILTQTAANETETLNLQALAPGSYVLILSDGNNKTIIKIVKE